MGDLRSDVRELLKRDGVADSAITLWDEIYTIYEQGSPEAVSEFIEGKVTAVRKAAKAEASEMRAAAGSVKRRGRSKKR